MDPKVRRHETDVESAIAGVLDAEHAARLAVDEAAVAATALAEATRAGAQSLSERTERRIRRIRNAFEQRTTDAVAALEAAAAEASAPHDLSPADLAQLDAAVAILAAKLTRGMP